MAERNLLRRLQISATIKDFKLIKDDIIIFLSEYVTNAKFLHILRKRYKILFMLCDYRRGWAAITKDPRVSVRSDLR